MRRTGVATTRPRPRPSRSSRPSRPARPCFRSPPSPGSATRCGASARRCCACSPASTFGRPRNMTVPASIWASRPADLYCRRDRDCLGTVLWGIRVLLEGFAATSRWQPSRVKPVRRTRTAVVTKRELVAPDVVALTLADPNGGLLPSWTPGAHIDVQLPSGRRRQYSLCGPPGRRTDYRIAIRRIADGGGGSIEMHDAFEAGDTLVFE